MNTPLQQPQGRPWETAPTPAPQTLYECPGPFWHDEGYYHADQLYWWGGNGGGPAGWYCEGCMHRMLTEVAGVGSAEVRAFYRDIDHHLTLADELCRRAGATPEG